MIKENFGQLIFRSNMNNVLRGLLFLSILLMLVSCKTNPPDIVNPNNNKGTLSVESDVVRPDVYLNNKFVGYANLTIQLNPGNYNIYLKKDTLFSDTQSVNIIADSTIKLFFVLRQKESVLLEDFANVSCDPCVESSRILDELKSTRYQNDELIVIRYATNFPSPNDPFYLNAQEMNDARIGYYNVLFAPTTIVDGIEKPISTDSTSIIESIENRLTLKAPFSIVASSTRIEGDSIHISGSGEFPELGYDNLRFFIVLMQKEVSFQNPPGSNGQTVFHDVAFAVLPNTDGLSLNKSRSGEEEFDFNYYYKNVNFVLPNNLEVVAFFQNSVTKEIYYAKKIY
jgi:hypothetical protein